jgi:hypothetical protein
MDVTSVSLARVTAFMSIEEVNPLGRVALVDLVKGLVERYKFAKFPKTFDDWTPDKGTEFVYGRFEEFEISKVTIYERGLSVDTRSSTDDCERVLEDLMTWGSSLGLVPRPHRRWYTSGLIFESNAALDAIHPALRSLAEKISAATERQLPARFETTSITVGMDPWNAKYPLIPFRIERREGVPFSEHKYWSQAPLPTRTHIELLKEFEAALGEVKPAW